jgi:hypothetical protein
MRLQPISLLLILAGAALHAQQPAPVALQLEVQDRSGTRVSDPAQLADSKQSITLDLHRAYQPGDRILFSGPQQMALRVDPSLPECLVYAPNPTSLAYQIPSGRSEQQTGVAYSPDAFSGDAHRITLRVLSEQERHIYRNLALNPCDQPQADLAIYPHATSNSVARNLFDFAARNAIDGVARNGHHGAWPYQSWGPELPPNAWWRLDFGRPVTIDKLRLMLRADFPHDGTWSSATVEFSDGSHITIQLAPTGDLQEFPIPSRRISWLRLTNLVPADPTKWCALVEFEAWGRE